MSDKPASHAPEVVHSSSTMPAASRIRVIESLVPVALAEVTAQLPGFIERLAGAMFRLSDQSVLPNEASVSFHAWNYLGKNAGQWQRGVLDQLSQAWLGEIAALDKTPLSGTAQTVSDLTLVSLEEMESRVLIGNLAQAVELENSAALVALNIRLGRLLQRDAISIAHNPFRPAVFVRAVHDAWCRFDGSDQSHRLVLRLLRPEVLIDFAPLLTALNGALIARGIVPDLLDDYRSRQSSRPSPEPSGVADAALRHKLEEWLNQVDGEPVAAPAAGPSATLLNYLDGLRQAAPVTSLREAARHAPADALTPADHNTIELLARMFDFVFGDSTIPDHVKQLLGRLQVPLLRTALVDKEFFFSAACPPRRLLDQLAASGRGLQHGAFADDPLYRFIEQIVERVQHEFDQQIGMYSTVVADLEAYLLAEQESEHSALRPRIDEARRQENIQQARELAENDIARRIESGEVAGFVEVFLETQWIHILMLAHSVAARKPEALDKALQAMDDLIWSVRPKVSPQERKDLVSKLPALLSLLNGWLNAVKWDAPERVTFFSNLAERHAAIVRLPAERSARHRIELAVNVAQKASERRLNRRAREMHEVPLDQFVHVVDSIEPGSWVRFVRNNGEAGTFRLAWISPLRTRFIFSSRHSDESFVFTADELAAALREQGAEVLPHGSVVTRALAAALEQ
ncbi:MAG: DUF1631 domain-containing protein [Oxalobacteraceae bacterium]|nr:DUF1631 domain-containing protein [Oxalobacteraceae bacterium]